jgi:hypothetical protein
LVRAASSGERRVDGRRHRVAHRRTANERLDTPTLLQPERTQDLMELIDEPSPAAISVLLGRGR